MVIVSHKSQIGTYCVIFSKLVCILCTHKVECSLNSLVGTPFYGMASDSNLRLEAFANVFTKYFSRHKTSAPNPDDWSKTSAKVFDFK